MNLESRVDNLEIRFTHNESSLEELTRTVLQLQGLLREQQETIRRLERQVRDLTPSQTSDAAQEIPPHY